MTMEISLAVFRSVWDSREVLNARVFGRVVESFGDLLSFGPVMERFGGVGSAVMGGSPGLPD